MCSKALQHCPGAVWSIMWPSSQWQSNRHLVLSYAINSLVSPNTSPCWARLLAHVMQNALQGRLAASYLASYLAASRISPFGLSWAPGAGVTGLELVWLGWSWCGWAGAKLLLKKSPLESWKFRTISKHLHLNTENTQRIWYQQTGYPMAKQQTCCMAGEFR